jgi:shikimate dehydrogenase
MAPFHVASDDLPALWQGLKSMRNLEGFLVTIPHKQQAAALCDRLDTQAAMVGAVSVVRRLADGEMLGGMFDGIGFVAGLRANGYEPRGKRVKLLGAGGAASAIAFALAEIGVTELAIANRTAAKSEALARQIAAVFPGCTVTVADSDPSGFELIVNATSLGLAPNDPLPLDPSRLTPAMTIAEIIMNPVETDLLVAAKRAGSMVQYGRQMLDHQMTPTTEFLGIDRA